MVLHLIAIMLVGVVGWSVFVLASPYRACRWCKGKRGVRCWRCKGRKLTRRFGARIVHKVKLSLLQAWNEREFWR